jgi:hypothetical protein
MDERGISSHDEFQAAFDGKTTVEQLRAAAQQSSPVAEFGQAPDAKARRSTWLSAGKGIDLTGTLGCYHYECLRKEADELLGKSWHYFDGVVLPDVAHSLIEGAHHDQDGLEERLASTADTIFYLRATSAMSLVRFESRLPACRQHWRDHAKEARIDQSIANVKNVITTLAREARIEFRAENISGHAHLEFALHHRFFEHVVAGHLCAEADGCPIPVSESEQRRAAAKSVVIRFIANLSADALSARKSDLPLGAAIRFYGQLLKNPVQNRIEDVAFALELPVLSDVPLRDLVEFRMSNQDLFQRFQSAIRKAARERINSAGSNNPSKIAQEILEDVIDVEVRAIGDRMDSYVRKRDNALALGAGVTLAGLTLGLLTPVAGLLAPVGVGLGAKAVKDFNDAKEDVSLSDMYFLWKAAEHFH